MFGRFLLLAGLLLSSCTTPEITPQVAEKSFEPILKACGDRDGWSDPAPPAHVFGNTYMVGTCGITSLLITTPKGHFLTDGATAEAAPLIADNIRKLGFEPKDVRYLLSTHEHIDHVGGLAELKRITGAKFVTRAEAKGAMESGTVHPTDPQLGLLPPFEPLKADLVIEDQEKLRIGDQSLTMIATPGHTPGGTSWTWKSCEGKTCRQIVYVDSLNAVSADTYRFSDHWTYVAILQSSMTKIAVLECDIVISPHPAQSAFFERLAGEAPLVNRDGCNAYAKAASERLVARLAKEAAE